MPRTRALWLAGYVVATFLAFPHPVAGGVLDLGVVCAWLSPALLLIGLDGLAPGRAARVGFVAGLVAHSAILHWIYVVTVSYGHASPVAGVLAPVALAAYVAVFPALLAVGWAWLARADQSSASGEREWPRRSEAEPQARTPCGGLAHPLAAAALWTALDHLRSMALSGFPWATLGYAQHLNPALLGLAPFTGVYGLSFVSVLGGAALARVFLDLRARRRPGAPVWGALAGVAVALVAGGAARLAHPEDASTPKIRVAVLQGNIDQGVKWSREWREEIFEIYAELSRAAADDGAEVVVWPETSVPGAIEADADLRERLARLARDTGARFVLGAVGLDFDGGTAPTHYFDSAFLLTPEGAYVERYDKSHLVPFGEYVPLRDLLGLVVVALARGTAPVDVAAGAGPRALTLERTVGPAVRVGVPICYELLFPDLMRRFGAGGAELLFAITNDAWYGRTGAPYQFLAITALRSAESRLWTARAANTGISAFIDARGRVVASTEIFERGLLVADVPLRPAPLGGSFYTRYGDVFAMACWVAVALLAAAAARRLRADRAGHQDLASGGAGNE